MSTNKKVTFSKNIKIFEYEGDFDNKKINVNESNPAKKFEQELEIMQSIADTIVEEGLKKAKENKERLQLENKKPVKRADFKFDDIKLPSSKSNSPKM